MSAAWFALGAAFAALAAVFLAVSGKAAEPARARGARLVGALFLVAALGFIAAGAIAMARP